MIIRIKQIRSLKTQHAARAPANAFPACEAVPIFYMFSCPGMPPHINTNWAVIGANTALHTSSGVRDHMACHQRFSSIRFLAKNTFKHYASIVMFLSVCVTVHAAAGVIGYIIMFIV
jgi:hypothetical protein